MIAKLIGIGAAGNKAAIAAVQSNVIDLTDVLLINSTLKDIPHDYSGEKYCFNNAYGGCGKERKIATEYIMNDINKGHLDIDKFLQVGVDKKQAELVIIVSSTEGGTGSGAAPLLADYIKSVLDIEARCFSFIGFGDDIRGLRNTVEYFKELKDKYAVECIENAKFLEAAGDDKIKAEKLANEEFCRKLSVLLGNMLKDSPHNIDPTDLLKVSAYTPNYSIVEYREFGKIKNKQEFRNMVQDMIDSSKALDISTPSQKRMAVMINIDEENTAAIDFKSVLLETYGECFEVFEHIQHETSLPHFMAFISAGNNIPIKEVEAVYENYKARSEKMNTSPDEFYTKSFDLNDAQDNAFDISKKKQGMSKASFFNQFSNNSSGNNQNNKPQKGGRPTGKIEDEF